MPDPPDLPPPPLPNPPNQTISESTSQNTRRKQTNSNRGKSRGQGGSNGGGHTTGGLNATAQAFEPRVASGSSNLQDGANTPPSRGSFQGNPSQSTRGRGKGRNHGRGSRGGSTTPTTNRGIAPEPKVPTHDNTPANASEGGAGPGPDGEAQSVPRNSRRRQFNSQLTAKEENVPSSAGRSNHARPRSSSKLDVPSGSAVSTKDMDLTSRLTSAFSRTAAADDAPDCPICFSTIGPGQPTWSCSPTLYGSDPLHDNGVTCWTSFHLKCIRSWATKSTKETRDAYLAREVDQLGEWRCPGCQTRRSIVPVDYRCFCGRSVDPKPGRLSTPHSCGDACSRPRVSCQHPCPLSCHPGPCPPCLLTITQRCHCGSQTLSLRCSQVTANTQDPSKPRAALAPLSCNKPCGKPLSCGSHTCDLPCHPGPCSECEIVDIVRCYCGKEEQDMKCGEGEPKFCQVRDENGTLQSWEGLFDCYQVCDRPFDCGNHRCQQKCHPPSIDPALCPFSPSAVSTCPCGAMSLFALQAPPRTSCFNIIPTCGQICGRPQGACEHLCALKCHEGICGRCEVITEEKCRCGRIGRKRKCWEIQEAMFGMTVDRDEFDDDDGVFTCDKKCTVLRNCGKHICGRICCPLAALAGVTDGPGKGKKKQRDVPTQFDLAELDPEGWHVCDLICNKRLACGNHQCTENDHRGPCPPCLQSSFDELTCACSRTTIMPPVPCGTIIKCPYPCARPAPPCGHPKTPHSCHENEDGCPPCPFLTTKRCNCGGADVRNIRCSQDKASCGMACGKLLDCGFHSCEKICHLGDCGTCSQVCGKPRKLCLPLQHPCTHPCHAPAACPEAEPCGAPVTLKCACGRLQQPSTCGISTSTPTSRVSQPLQCVQECLVAKRNERLASALGISADRSSRATGSEAVYSDSLQTYYRTNQSFAATVEKNLSEFVTSAKRMVVLAPMPPPRRKFVRELAEIFRLDTEEVDQEPRRSVQLLRRVDSRIPNPLLSTVVRPPPTNKTTGLVALKKTGSSSAPLLTGSSTGAGTGGAVPGKVAWGGRPLNIQTPTPVAGSSTLPRPQASVSARPTPPTSRPRTPNTLLAVQPPQPVQSQPQDVPDSWEEE